MKRSIFVYLSGFLSCVLVLALVAATHSPTKAVTDRSWATATSSSSTSAAAATSGSRAQKIPYDYLDKVFIGHLHVDHMGTCPASGSAAR